MEPRITPRLNASYCTIKIDDYVEIDADSKRTGDYAKIGEHLYSDKAPGPSFLAVPIYALVRPILTTDFVQTRLRRLADNPSLAETLNEEGTGINQDKIHEMVVLVLSTFTVITIPSVLLCLVLFYFLGIFGIPLHVRSFTVLIYALATPAFPYSWAFYSHQLTAFLVFTSFYLGYQIKHNSYSKRWLYPIALMLAYAVICEYPMFLLSCIVYLYIVRGVSPDNKTSVAFTLTGMLPAILLGLYFTAIFGHPFGLPYSHSVHYQHLHHQGLISIGLPTRDGLWGLTFSSSRGLFLISPILLLSLVGLYQLRQKGTLRAEWLVIILSPAVLFMFYSGSVMWQGGFSVASRYIVPALPYLAIGLGIFLHRWGGQLWAIIMTGLFLVWSICAVWGLSITGQNFPDLELEDPLISHAWQNVIDDNGP